MARKLAEDWYECAKCKGHFTADGFYKTRSGVVVGYCKGCAVAARSKFATSRRKKYTPETVNFFCNIDK